MSSLPPDMKAEAVEKVARAIWLSPKRWPVIRHVRWIYWDWKVYNFACEWSRISGFFSINPSDTEYLDGIWHGKH